MKQPEVIRDTQPHFPERENDVKPSEPVIKDKIDDLFDSPPKQEVR